MGRLSRGNLLAMNIPDSQIVVKKKVGRANGKEVTYLKTVGGLHLVVNHRGTVLGSGPHRAVARKIAQQFEPNLEWTELSKSDHVDSSYIEHLLPEYEALTRQMRQAQGVE